MAKFWLTWEADGLSISRSTPSELKWTLVDGTRVVVLVEAPDVETAKTIVIKAYDLDTEVQMAEVAESNRSVVEERRTRHLEEMKRIYG